VEEALQMPKDELTVTRRRNVAALLDWPVIVEAMSKLVESSVANKKG
jgi:hypothetical protein